MAINSPLDISGCVWWTSAEYEDANYNDGDQMTGWTNLATSGQDMVGAGSTKPLWKATDGPGSGPTVRFQGTGYFTLPDLLTGSTAGEVMTYIKSDGGDIGMWAFGSNGSGQNHYPFSGSVYDSWGYNTRWSFSPSPSITSAFRRYNVSAASADWIARLDASVQSTQTSGAVAWDPSPMLGRSVGPGLIFAGHVTTLIAYSRKLTSGERSDLDDWMVANPNGGLEPDPTLVVADLALALTEDAPVLTQVHSLAVADVALSLTEDAVTLTLPAETLVVADLALGLSLDATVLTANDSLVVADLTLGLTTDNVVLVPLITEDVDTEPTDASVSGRRSRTGFATVSAVPPVAARLGPIKRTSLTFPAPTLVDGRPV